jgi:uncharacterized protein
VRGCRIRTAEPAREGAAAPPDIGVLLVVGVLSVAAVAAGHDAAINASARLDVPAEQFFGAATRALLDGLARAGVGRLVAIGIGTVLEVAPGTPLYATPDFPAQAREFSLGHAVELEMLRATDTPIDWLVLAPPPTMLDPDGPRTGRYRSGGNQVLPAEAGTPLFRYADLAVAVVDEIEAPKRHRVLAAVAHDQP